MIYEPCQDGEDLQFLAFCAVTRRFELLLEGYVRPDHMSSHGQQIAEWLLEARASNAIEWPPTYRSLKLQWPEFSWPPVPEDPTLDPLLPAQEVLNSYKIAKSVSLHTQIERLRNLNFVDEEYKEASIRLMDEVRKLMDIGNAAPSARRVADDPAAFMAWMAGQGADGLLAQIDTGFAPIDDIITPLLTGLYGFFGRPKSGKSYILGKIMLNISLEQGHPAVLVDPENDERDIEMRLACAAMGVSVKDATDIRKKMARNESLDAVESDLLERIYDGVELLSRQSHIVLLGKGAIDPDYGHIPLDTAVEAMNEIGARCLFVDQVHKTVVRSLARRGDKDVTRAYKAMQFLDGQEGRACFFTTQENRPPRASKSVGRMPSPSPDHVFGSDAAAQTCRFLAHVHAWQISKRRIFQMITPLLSRGQGLEEDPRIFWEAGFWDHFDICSQQEGIARAEVLCLNQRQRVEGVGRRAQKMASEDGETANFAPDQHKGRRGVTGIPARVRTTLNTDPEQQRDYAEGKPTK